MLLELRIHDFAIIDRLELRLDAGFIAFTGETGAGKSIMIDAVELLMGGRADSTVVRAGAELALVEGTFRLAPALREAIHSILEREGLLDDPDHLMLAREVRREGRNLARVNGRTVTVGMLRELGELLVDVHGQSEHLSLLRVPEHLHLLDRYAHVHSLHEEYASVYRELGKMRSELQALRKREREAAQRIEYLQYQVEEIDAAALEAGEDEVLVEERTRLANAEQLTEKAGLAVAALDEGLRDEVAATDLLGQAVEALQGLAEFDPSMRPTQEEGQALLEQLGDLARRLRIYQESVEHDPKRLDEVEERLGLIRSLERKYGGGIESVLTHAETARRELEDITHAEERIAVLESEEGRLLNVLAQSGARLSQARHEAAERLASGIERELADLHMSGARFGVDLHWEEDASGVPLDGRMVGFGPHGLDQVEFLVEPNPGEGLKPLARIASGGETSRLMLGLKSVLAQADRTPTLIFDEIDQGIGGRVGAVVGRKLWRLAADHQVLCVTHLPQLAAFGDQHFKVDKALEEGRTVTRVLALEGEARVAELALMLGGTSSPNLESAADLLRHAGGEKAAAASG